MNVGINTLKIGYNRVSGYYIELTRAQAEQAPADYIRRQTLKMLNATLPLSLRVLKIKSCRASHVHSLVKKHYSKLCLKTFAKISPTYK